MSCDDIVQKLGFYVDGALDARSLEEVETHIQGCADCQAELAALRLIISTAREIEEVEPPVDLRARIAAATTARDVQAAGRVPLLTRLARAFAPPAVRWATGTVAITAAVLIALSLKPAPQILIKTAAHRPKPAVTVQQKTSPPPSARIATAPEPKPTPVVAVRRHHRSLRPQVVATVKSAKAPKKLLPDVIVPAKPDKAPADVANNIEADTTSSTVTVSAKELQNAETVAAEVPVKTIDKASAKLASHPLTNQEQVQRWVEEAKTEAAMHRRDRGPAGLKLLSTRF